MVLLQYFNGKEWLECGSFGNERIAWISLGGDDLNYRTLEKESGKVLTSKQIAETTICIICKDDYEDDAKEIFIGNACPDCFNSNDNATLIDKAMENADKP